MTKELLQNIKLPNTCAYTNTNTQRYIYGHALHKMTLNFFNKAERQSDLRAAAETNEWLLVPLTFYVPPNFPL